MAEKEDEFVKMPKTSHASETSKRAVQNEILQADVDVPIGRIQECIYVRSAIRNTHYVS